MLLKEVVSQPTVPAPSSPRSRCGAAMGQVDSSGRSMGISFLFRSGVSLPFDQPDASIRTEAAKPLYPAQKKPLGLWVGLGRDVGLPSPMAAYPYITLIVT